MPRRWDDWDKMKSKRHRHGRPDWSRPGRVDARAARDAEREAERERRRARRKGRELTPEEETYLEARRTAERKIRFFQHLVSYAFVVLFLWAIVATKVAMIVAFSWGIGLASHYFQAVVAPDLRRKWVRGEVDRQVSRTVSRQRVALEDEKLRSLEELSASIAHEIRNPITAAKSLVQQLGEDPGSAENVEYAQIALQELDRVERSISHLLRYAREEEMHPEKMKLVDAAESALETVRERLDSARVKVSRDFDVPGEMVGDTEQLYGSVTSGDIADFLKAKGFEIDKRKLILPEPIKLIGEHTVPLKLHREVTVPLKVRVAKEGSETA